MNDLDRQINTTLDTLPLVASPPHLVSRVMARTRAPQIAFQLDFLDFALPVFFAFLAALGLCAAALALHWLDPLMLLEWKFALQVAALHLPAVSLRLLPALALCLSAGLLVIGLALLLGWGTMERSYPRARG